MPLIANAVVTLLIIFSEVAWQYAIVTKKRPLLACSKCPCEEDLDRVLND